MTEEEYDWQADPSGYAHAAGPTTFYCATHRNTLDLAVNPDMICLGEEDECDVEIMPAFRCASCLHWAWWAEWVAEVSVRWEGDRPRWQGYHSYAYGMAHYNGSEGSPIHPRLEGQRGDGRCPYCLSADFDQSSDEYGMP